MDFLRNNLLTLLIATVLFALGVQTYMGEHGLQARSALKARIAGLEQKKRLLQEEKQRLERQIKLMAPGNVDRDMLEYQARELLDFVYDKEHVYITSQPE